MISSRDRILNAINLSTNDRIPLMEIGIWKETHERWLGEGLDPKAVHIYADNGASFYSTDGNPLFEKIPEYTLDDYFGLDRTFIFDFNCSIGLQQSIIKEDEDFIYLEDANGVTVKKFKNRTAHPLVVKNKIKEKSDWFKVQDLLRADSDRYSKQLLKMNRDAADRGHFCVVSPLESFWFTLTILGEENCLMKTALESDFLELIFEWQTNFQLEMLELMLGDGFSIDALWYFSDLCYKNGMLFSPDFYREVLMKYHKRIFNFCHARNIKIIYHSDGNVKTLLPLLIEAGIDCIQPLEARQGNNVIEYKKKYGSEVTFIGNINADVLGTTKPKIEQEVMGKILTAKKNGGYIFHSDHSIPPTVSLENYTYAVSLAKEFGKY